jgi:hypothetical protein
VDWVVTFRGIHNLCIHSDPSLADSLLVDSLKACPESSPPGGQEVFVHPYAAKIIVFVQQTF